MKTTTLDELLTDYRFSPEHLGCEIDEKDHIYLSRYFDDVELYLRPFGLSIVEQDQVREMALKHGTQVAVSDILSLWTRRDIFAATLRALLEILLSLGKEKIASSVCDYYKQSLSGTVHCVYLTVD